MLSSLFLLSIFSLPSFHAISQVKSQHAVQTELPLVNLQKEGRWAAYQDAFLSGRTFMQFRFQTTDFTCIHHSYNDLLQTRFKHLAVLWRNVHTLSFSIPARMTSQYPDEDFSPLS